MKKSWLIVTLFLSGCSIIPDPGEPPKRFVLDAAKPMVEKKRSPHKLVVEIPNVYPPLDSQRIGVMPEANRIDYYADCEWGDRLGVLIQDSLVYSLQNRQIFAGVTRTNDSIFPDLLLKTDVRKFFIAQKPKPTAVVQYYVQLIRLQDHHVISQQAFETTLPLAEESLQEVSTKLNEANTQATLKILDWLKEEATT